MYIYLCVCVCVINRLIFTNELRNLIRKKINSLNINFQKVNNFKEINLKFLHIIEV